MKCFRLCIAATQLVALTSILAACGSTKLPPGQAPNPQSSAPAGVEVTPGVTPIPRPATDGPGAQIPPNLEAVPDATPKNEPLASGANKPYAAAGQTYVPDTSSRPFQQRGLASWYGRKFHGNKTASGEIYDMYAMTAAHPTLPIPSYARVTHLISGKSVVVRINDRGPFAGGRVIDLSYTAASKLGFIDAGEAEVLVERVFPADAVVAPFPSAVTDSPPPALAGGPTPRAPRAGNPPVPAVASVAVESAAPQSATKGLRLQAGAFSAADNAQRLAQRIRDQVPSLAGLTHVEMAALKGKTIFRVLIGAFADEAQRRDAARAVEAAIGSAVTLR